MCPKLEPLHICRLQVYRKSTFWKKQVSFYIFKLKRWTCWALVETQSRQLRLNVEQADIKRLQAQDPSKTSADEKKKKKQPQMQPFPFSLSLCSSSPGLLLHCASPQTYLLSRWPVFHCLRLHFVIVSSRTAPRPRFYSGAEDGQARIDSGQCLERAPRTHVKRATHKRQVILRPDTHHLVPTNLI